MYQAIVISINTTSWKILSTYITLFHTPSIPQLWFLHMIKETDETTSYLTLLFRPLQDAFLDGSLTDEPVDGDLLRLSQSVGAVHRLLVYRRIPVAVIEDHLENTTHMVYWFWFGHHGVEIKRMEKIGAWELLMRVCFILGSSLRVKCYILDSQLQVCFILNNILRVLNSLVRCYILYSTLSDAFWLKTFDFIPFVQNAFYELGFV